MWLIYLQFEDQGTLMTMHVRCGSRSEVNEIMAMAKTRGFTPTATLKEYAIFSSGTTIQPRTVPNFHYYRAQEFRAKWEAST